MAFMPLPWALYFATSKLERTRWISAFAYLRQAQRDRQAEMTTKFVSI
jgi:hypothetical protein